MSRLNVLKEEVSWKDFLNFPSHYLTQIAFRLEDRAIQLMIAFLVLAIGSIMVVLELFFGNVLIFTGGAEIIFVAFKLRQEAKDLRRMMDDDRPPIEQRTPETKG